MRFSLRRDRWWLALVAAMVTPWIGPHIDRYVPVGLALFVARESTPDAGFWVIAALLIGAAYLAWFAVLTGFAAWGARRRRHER